MTNSASKHAVFLEAAPFLLVDDVVATAEYYRDTLGFTFDRFFGDPPGFVIVRRNSARIMFRQAPQSARPAARPNDAKMNEALDFYIWVSDVDALAEEFRAAGANIVDAPFDADPHRREMSVRDLNGYLLFFGQVQSWPD